MLHALLAIGALAWAPTAVELKSRVVSASIFKPGLVLVVREVTVPEGKGRYKVDFLPDALDGSFWYGGEGVKIKDVETKLRFVDETSKVEAKTIPDFLSANIGKTVKVTVPRNVQAPETETIVGTLVDLGAPPYGSMTLKLANGDLRAVSVGSVVGLSTIGLGNTVERTAKKPVQEIEFEADAGKATKVGFMTLENGAAWSSSYLVTLDDEKTAKVVAKAQVAVGPLKFEDTVVNVVAGLPNLPTVVKFDLAAGFGSLQSYLKGTQENYRPYRFVNRDPYTSLPTFFERYNQGFGGGQGGYIAAGNFGGGMGGGGMSYDALVRAGAEPGGNYGNRDEKELAAELALARVEDVFSYPLGKMSLEPGDRVTRMLASGSATYERMFRWELTDTENPYQQLVHTSRVVKLLRLANAGKVPWTGGKCLVLKEGNPLAQVDMPFTAPGQNANLELGEVQDISTDYESREVSRENAAPFYGRNWVAVTVDDTLSATNDRPEEVKLEVRYQFNGKVVKAEGAELKERGESLNAANPLSVVTWTVVLKPGEKKKMTVRRTTLL